MASVVYGDFEWDGAKAATNARKHGVTFEEASTVFADPCYILLRDDTHPEHFWAIGMSGVARVLTVVNVERGQRVRIIKPPARDPLRGTGLCTTSILNPARRTTR